MVDLLTSLAQQEVESRGWKRCNEGELRVILALEAVGVKATDVHQQFNLGRYHLDFAFVMERVAVEADGWAHTTKPRRQLDRLRDKQLRDWGWTTVRIDTYTSSDAQIKAIVLAVMLTINETRRGRRPLLDLVHITERDLANLPALIHKAAETILFNRTAPDIHSLPPGARLAKRRLTD